LSRDLPAVVLIVLHRPFDTVSHLQAVLNRNSTLPIHIAKDGDRFCPGNGYIGEPDAHLALAANSYGELIADPNKLYGNRTVDVLFRSVAIHATGGFIGIVLSGSVDDGSRGLAAIREAGGVTMVLTQPTTTWPGMPENALRFAGPIDFVGSPEAIAAEVTKRALAAQSQRPQLG
jgi:two-component system chemotaxis response regulator CheB